MDNSWFRCINGFIKRKKDYSRREKDFEFRQKITELEDIHESQLDKAKVKRVIDKDITFFLLQTKERANKMKVTYARHIIKILRGIKKELGVE